MAMPTTPGQRAAAYWFIDGLPEIAYGALYVVWGILGLYWRQYAVPHMRWGVFAAGALFIVLFVTDRRVLGFLKSRFTWRRTGYVRPPADPTQYSKPDTITLNSDLRPVDDNSTQFRLRTVLLPFIFSRFVAAFLQNPWGMALVTCALAATLHVSTRNDARRYSIGAVLPLALVGIAAAFLKLDPQALEFVPIVLGGAWFVAVGGVSLVHYVSESRS